MSINQVILGALSSLAPARPDFYKDPPPIYYTFNYSTLPDNFGDDAPGHERHLVQVHLFCPLNHNSLTLRAATKSALFRAGLTWPTETDAGAEGLLSGPNEGEDGRQHRVFECEWAGAVDSG